MSTAEAQNAVGGESGRVLTADVIAASAGGRVIGDGGAAVSSIAPLDRATERDLTFLAAARYAPLLAESRAAVVLVTPELAEAPGSVKARVVVADPHQALLALIPQLYRAPARTPGVHATAVIGRGVALGRDVAIGAYAVIGDGAQVGDRVTIGAGAVIGAGVSLGEDALIHPSVTLYPGAVIGKRVILHSGVRIASDGFGYVFRNGAHEKIPHVGRAILEDDVEIGANTTVDRGSIGDTVIGAGTKIDNMVHVGHNVRIGRLCLLMAQVGVSGSTRIEDGCIIAGQVGIAGHHTIGKGARLAAQAGVFGDVPAGETWSGYPARPHKEALRAQASMFRLPSLIRELEAMIEERRAARDGGKA